MVVTSSPDESVLPMGSGAADTFAIIAPPPRKNGWMDIRRAPPDLVVVERSTATDAGQRFLALYLR
jgi:hypothetical protein